jgi:hypothetical protein
LSENIPVAVKEFVELLLAAYGGVSGHVHAETVIGGAAALTGEFAQRATGLSITPGDPLVMFGDAINDVLIEGASHGRVTVWQCIERAARDAGVTPHEMPDPLAVMRNVAGAVGSKSFPPLTVPERHYPKEWSPNACARLRGRIVPVAGQLDLSRHDLAIALAMATGALIRLNRGVLPPAIGARLAIEIAFGVARMAPIADPIF